MLTCMLQCLSRIFFLMCGFGMSLFYGFKAVEVFVDTDHGFASKKKDCPSWKFHQWWLNFMGSAVGWLAAFYFTFCRFIPSLHDFKFTASDGVLILVALLGMGGLLPFTLSVVPTSLGSLVSGKEG